MTNNKTELLIEWMDKLKSVFQLQYDYFKYLIPLSTGSILILMAFMENIFTNLNVSIKIFIFISFFGFLLTIAFSLVALPISIKLIQDMTLTQYPGIGASDDVFKKIKDKLKWIKIFGYMVISSYIFGIFMLLLGTGIYFLN